MHLGKKVNIKIIESVDIVQGTKLNELSIKLCFCKEKLKSLNIIFVSYYCVNSNVLYLVPRAFSLQKALDIFKGELPKTLIALFAFV